MKKKLFYEIEEVFSSVVIVYIRDGVTIEVYCLMSLFRNCLWYYETMIENDALYIDVSGIGRREWEKPDDIVADPYDNVVVGRDGFLKLYNGLFPNVEANAPHYLLSFATWCFIMGEWTQCLDLLNNLNLEKFPNHDTL